jgi:hypothetical protein
LYTERICAERRDTVARMYKTAGRQRLLEFLESRPDCQFTVEELCHEMDRQDG